MIGGTIGFMAPEVFQRGEAPAIAADIYGLGALLWTLVVGNSPNGRPSIHRDDELAPIAQVCRKCLAENPKDRYRNAKDFQDEIWRVLK